MVLNEPLRISLLQFFAIIFASNFSEVLLFDLTECSMMCNLKAKNYVEFLLLFAFPLYVVWAVIKICILMIQLLRQKN